MRAGKLRQLVTIQSVIVTQSATGAPQRTFQDFAKVWASFEPITLKSAEMVLAQQEQNQAMYRATIRHMDGIDTTMRVVFDGNAYDIASILHDPTFRSEIVLMLKVGVRYQNG
jgi:SPP1 family predicted phage head-tail adaptor